MKSLQQAFLFLVLSGLWFTGCENKDFDAPPHEEPQYAGAATISIKDFKAKYASYDLKEITDNDVITGVVTGNDESGNLYKQLFIQDETGALMVAINQASLYNYYPVGQKVFIEAKGLFMGKYGGMQQLGYKYSKNNDDNYTIGQAPWDIFKAKIFRHGYYSPEAATPQTITFNEFTSDNLGKLVTLEGVAFTDAGQIYSYPASGNNVQTLNRVIYSAADPAKTVTSRMSSAADFAADTIPSGVGKATGILTVFQSGSSTTYQFLVRHRQDVSFVANADGWGLQQSPWTVGYAIANQNAGKTGWVKGYIVGTLQPGVNNDSNPIDSNDDIAFEAPFALANYVVIATSATERDYTKCLVVNLPSGSALRTAVNLVDNAANLGKELRVTGSLEKILGGSAVKVATGASSEFVFGNAGLELLNAPFTSTLEPFTAVSVSGSQTWTLDSYGYAKITGFVSPTNYANEDWLISPSINLTDYSAANVSFTHITRYGTNATDFTLWVSDNYTDGLPSTATWTQIAIPNFSSGSSWTDWTGSGNLSIPAAFMGKNNVRVALKYISTSSKAGTWELKSLVVKSGPGDSGTVDPGTGGDDSLVSAPFSSTLSPFSAYSVSGTQVWGHDSYGYAKMTGYVNPSNFENEDWLISPAIDLSAQTAAYITFDHVSRYAANNATDLTLWVSDNYTGGAPSSATWTQVVIAKYSSGSSWTDWTNTGKLSIPSALMGKSNVYVALKYLSSSTAAGTWEVKNLYVKSGEGDGAVDPDPGTGGDGTQFFLETFGTGTHTSLETRPKIADFTGFDNTNVTYSDASNTVTIRSTSTLNAHIWMPATSDSYLTISGIDASAYSDVRLQFDFTGNGATNSDKIIVKVNDEAVAVPSLAAASNTYVTVAIPQALTVSGTFKLEFVATAANNTVGFRIDNIKLTGTPK